MMEMSNGKIKASDIQFRAEIELIDTLNKEGVYWEKLEANKKYGTVLKIRKPTEEIKMLSEPLDPRNIKKYKSFLF